MEHTPVLLVTHDDLLWQHWQDKLEGGRWLLARGRAVDDLRRWRDQGRLLAMLDAGLPRLPAWSDASWTDIAGGLRLMVASLRPNDDEGAQVIGSGACGYFHGYANAETLQQVLEAVDSGVIWMGQSLLSRLLKAVNVRVPEAARWDAGLLTEREITIARCVASGQNNADIAQELGITERTVKAHLTSIFEKLGVSDRLQLALRVHGIAV
jgi:DNA-binding NarL/FixJ family response regulator